jgi:hypothetical protein
VTRVPRRDRGSTIPLILGFVIVAFFLVAGAVALGDAFVQQRDLQDVCDGAAAAAAAAAVEVQRGGAGTQGPDAQGPDAQGPDAQGPDAQGPDAQGPDAQGPDAQGPDAQGPDALPFAAERLEPVIATYLRGDPDRSGVQVRTELSSDALTLTLRCTEHRSLAFGAIFGQDEITHNTTSSTRAEVRD